MAVSVADCNMSPLGRFVACTRQHSLARWCRRDHASLVERYGAGCKRLAQAVALLQHGLHLLPQQLFRAERLFQAPNPLQHLLRRHAHPARPRHHGLCHAPRLRRRPPPPRPPPTIVKPRRGRRQFRAPRCPRRRRPRCQNRCRLRPRCSAPTFFLAHVLPVAAGRAGGDDVARRCAQARSRGPGAELLTTALWHPCRVFCKVGLDRRKPWHEFAVVRTSQPRPVWWRACAAILRRGLAGGGSALPLGSPHQAPLAEPAGAWRAQLAIVFHPPRRPRVRGFQLPPVLIRLKLVGKVSLRVS